MIKLKPREKYLLIILIVIFLISLFYMKIFDKFSTSPIKSRQQIIYKKYSNLLMSETEIKNKNKLIFETKYWKSSVEEQKIEFQKIVEDIASKSNIKTIKNMYPLNSVDKKYYTEIGLQISLETDLNSLVEFMSMIENLAIPIKIDSLKIYEEDSVKSIRSEITLTSLYVNP